MLAPDSQRGITYVTRLLRAKSTTCDPPFSSYQAFELLRVDGPKNDSMNLSDLNK